MLDRIEIRLLLRRRRRVRVQVGAILQVCKILEAQAVVWFEKPKDVTFRLAFGAEVLVPVRREILLIREEK